MAVIGSRLFKLRDGRDAIIRSGEERDALRLIDVAHELLADGEGQVREVDEFKMSEEQERAWVRNLQDAPHAILLVVESADLIVGILNFTPGGSRRLAHTGQFGMGIRKGWRELGIGRTLMETLKEWAVSTNVIEKINLKVTADNPRAIDLYLSLGFREDGRKHREIKKGEGDYVDEISMELLLR